MMLRRARLTSLSVAVAIIVAVLALLSAGTAEARVGEARNLPSFHGIGWVSLTSASFKGTVNVDYASGPHCIYVQYKHVAVAGIDATWNRLTSNSCGLPLTRAWSAPTNRPFNGIKFRICQDKPGFDDCGGDTTIYR